MMKSYIEHNIENLRKSMDWEAEKCEDFHSNLIEKVTKCTSQEIADGCLDSIIANITRYVSEVKSLRDQIELLELILKIAE